jgi:hypothetical protein
VRASYSLSKISKRRERREIEKWKGIYGLLKKKGVDSTISRVWELGVRTRQVLPFFLSLVFSKRERMKEKAACERSVTQKSQRREPRT